MPLGRKARMRVVVQALVPPQPAQAQAQAQTQGQTQAQGQTQGQTQTYLDWNDKDKEAKTHDSSWANFKGEKHQHKHHKQRRCPQIVKQNLHLKQPLRVIAHHVCDSANILVCKGANRQMEEGNKHKKVGDWLVCMCICMCVCECKCVCVSVSVCVVCVCVFVLSGHWR